MAAGSLRTGLFNQTQLTNHGSFTTYYPKTRASANLSSRPVRASQEPIDGMFSLRKRIEDYVLRAEMLAPVALEHEEANHINQEEVICDYDLWDDLSKSNDILNKLADSAKVVDTLRDLKDKAEEARLITDLAEMDGINYALFKQAYSASLDVLKFLDMYEMSKLLKEPYDMEGACITIESRCGDTSSETWAGQLSQMYMKWVERQDHAGRMVESSLSNNGGIKSVTIELEFKFAYGYLSGERGVHSRSSQNTSAQPEASFAFVDVIPLFIESSPDLSIDDEDILVSYPSSCEEDQCRTSLAVHIQHIPTGLEVQSTGERSRFANKVKALNRLKSKLLIIMRDQGLSSIKSIKKGAKMNPWSQETRKYVFQPLNMVYDLKSGLQIPDVNAVLNGYLHPLIAAHIDSRQTSTIN